MIGLSGIGGSYNGAFLLGSVVEFTPVSHTPRNIGKTILVGRLLRPLFSGVATLLSLQTSAFAEREAKI